jgi:hypothetical protein
MRACSCVTCIFLSCRTLERERVGGGVLRAARDAGLASGFTTVTVLHHAM